MATEKPKEVHVDLLAIDMEEGVHWLHPGRIKENDPRLKAIRDKYRDQHVAEMNARKRPKTSK
jgi:hypothetical protein